jgi:lysophospholipase L1-like esterase
MKPVHVLLFLLCVLGLLAVVGTLMPREGILIAHDDHGGETRLRFPAPQDILFPVEEEKVDISDILALTTNDTAVADVDTIAALSPETVSVEPFVFDPSRIAPLEERIALHFPKGDKSVLYPVFAALEEARRSARPVRVMHYGDSQIEGDRITSYVRNKLQSQFGGSGPGLLAVADIVPSFSVERIISPNWERYSVMDRRSADLPHNRFGALSAFSRFSPILPDSVAPDTTVVHTATITLKPQKRAYGKAQVYEECRLYFGWHRAPVTISLTADGTPIASETIEPTAALETRTWRFPATPQELTITFTGADSPDVFGISLEGRGGVCMDNIAARGAAGYELRRGDQTLQQAMFRDLNVRLLILQYGGNVLPNIKDSAEVEQYGRFFGGQIARFKKMLPGVGIIVIGPSDMSIKEGEHYVTRPYLEQVRDAMKANTLAQGAVFWDMYAAMGGRNSMVSWVEADPPLAATDYTHFSPLGARKVGELFYTALINEFAAYHATQGTTRTGIKKETDGTPPLP